jgi:small-conductance mechanosensitive channel
MDLGTQIQAFFSYPLIKLSAGTVTVAALCIALVMLFGSRIVGRFGASRLNRMLERQNVPEGSRFAISKMIQYSATLVGVLMAVTSVGIRLDALFAASTVVLVGIGFGLQNIAQNFISGVILLLERPVSRGDFVQLGNAAGTVVDIGMRATRVVTREEVTIIVPNSELITAQVINHSVPTRNLRILVRVGVAYGSDTAKVSELLMKVARGDSGILRDPTPEVRLEDFGDSCLVFNLLAWIDNPPEDRRTASRLRFAIDKAFREGGIQIPLPQREVHMREGKLS